MENKNNTKSSNLKNNITKSDTKTTGIYVSYVWQTKVSYNVGSGLSIHSSPIIISSDMLRSESTSSSLSLCSHSKFSSSKRYAQKILPQLVY